MSKPIHLPGAVIAITGGARGIGLAIAEALQAEGARISIGDVDVALAQKEAKRLGAFAHVLDVRKPDSFGEFLRATEAALGPVDVLVNNAGIMPMGGFLDEDPALSDAQIDINFRGVINGMRLALPGMIARGSGHVVNVASLAGRFAIPGASIYCGTKFAVVGLTESVAAEFRDSGVNFTTIMPSAVSTELTSGTDAAAKGMLPVVTPQAVADAVVKSLKSPRLMVAVPEYLGRAHVLYGMIPQRALDFGRRLIDDHRLLKKLDHEAHAGYDKRISALAVPRKS
jgi:NADP-dependent 3-hydroxy acid dehydrogenase YdfG